MDTTTGRNGNERIEFLKRRENEIRAQIATERVKRQKRNEKDNARLFSIVGAALVQNAAQHHDFEMMLTNILATAEMRDGDRAFLKSKGWRL